MWRGTVDRRAAPQTLDTQPILERLYGQPTSVDWPFSMLIATLLASFAVYRVAYMIAREEGPFDMFDRLRLSVSRLPAKTSGNRTRPHWIQRGLGCPLCISWWLALPAAFIVVYSLSEPLLVAFALWPVIAGICLFLYQMGGT